MQFDTSALIDIRIPSSDGYKTLTCSFPSDKAWALRSSKSKYITKALGRGKSVQERSGSFQPDLDLVNSILQDKTAVLDEFEASSILAKLGRADIVESTREGNQFTVVLKVLGNITTTHVLRMPSVKEAHQYQSQTFPPRVSEKNTSLLTVRLEPSGELYDKLVISKEGYVDQVPLLHKSEIVSEVITMMAREDEEEDGETSPNG